jgi:hypothetical protein
VAPIWIEQFILTCRNVVVLWCWRAAYMPSKLVHSIGYEVNACRVGLIGEYCSKQMFQSDGNWLPIRLMAVERSLPAINCDWNKLHRILFGGSAPNVLALHAISKTRGPITNRLIDLLIACRAGTFGAIMWKGGGCYGWSIFWCESLVGLRQSRIKRWKTSKLI